MPVIFDDAEREKIRLQLLENGRRMILERGITRMNLEELALSAGIAKGTFYNFFPSKQRFILEILYRYQDHKLAQLKELSAAKQEPLTLSEALKWYRTVFLPEENPLFQMRQKDMEWIMEKIPAQELFRPELDEALCRTILSCVQGVRPDLDYRVLVNFPKMILFSVQNREYLHQDVLDRNVQMILGLMMQYITGEIS